MKKKRNNPFSQIIGELTDRKGYKSSDEYLRNDVKDNNFNNTITERNNSRNNSDVNKINNFDGLDESRKNYRKDCDIQNSPYPRDKYTPSCIPQKQCLNEPVPLHNYTGNPNEYTGVGSILPRFSYKQEYEYDSSCPRSEYYSRSGLTEEESS